jgi:hypothetical protein
MRTELIEILSAQRDSKFSNGRLSGLLCWPHGQDIKNSPVEPHSKISKSGMGVMGVLRRLGILGRKTKMKNSLAQRHSKFSNGRLSGVFCWPQWQDINNSHAQRDSKITKLGFCCSTRPSRTVDLRTCPRRARTTTTKAISKTRHAQPHSNISKFKKNQTLHSLHELHGEEMYSAQPHSKNSKSFAISGIWNESHKRSKSKHALFKTEFPIILLRNITDIKDDHNDCKK